MREEPQRQAIDGDTPPGGAASMPPRHRDVDADQLAGWRATP
ncbi:hypothetical protein BEI_1118 [Halomonas beimenensis]|uniref:Uncharacterized protein n=1 Tax=Halomonas beimenensis TaxID=475662 RepID=A0A291P5G3_9GAMM|nr:hypothetical protein BEI_1118 [Halomonas beimenensis]